MSIIMAHAMIKSALLSSGSGSSSMTAGDHKRRAGASALNSRGLIRLLARASWPSSGLVMIILSVLSAGARDRLGGAVCAQSTQFASNAGDNQRAATNQSNGGATAATKPYWQRPGCHQVGHTRTISIPGCVKFNLTTNACRGFCVSFSIPATDDLGPPADGLDGPATGESPSLTTGAQSRLRPDNLARVLYRHSGSPSASLQEINGDALAQQTIIARHIHGAPERGQGGGGGGGNKQMGDFLQLAGQPQSPLVGVVGDLSDKRDVISVSQCCNMMETEDVTVNLRCGLNETRRLVFKSAKTCECFFCKHV